MTQQNRHGFTLLELVIIVIIIGVISAVTLPLLSNALQQQRVRNAAAAVENMYVKARTVAMQRSSYTRIMGLQSGSLSILTLDPVTGAWESVGQAEDVASRFNVSITSTPYDYIWINHRGLGYYAEDTVTVWSGADTIELKISRYGRITR